MILELKTFQDIANWPTPSDIDCIVTHGYYATGDGGGGFYKRTPTQPILPGYGTSATGGYFALDGTALNVKQFGAKGDGVTDDTIAVHAAMDVAKAKRASLFFPAGVYRVTAGYDQAEAYNDIKIFGETRISEYTGGVSYGSCIKLDNAAPDSFFFKQSGRFCLTVRDMQFTCAQNVADRRFFIFTSPVTSFFLENIDFESVEKPVNFIAPCYFQSSIIRNVQFRGSGTIYSEVGGPDETNNLRGTLLILDNVNHEGFVPENTSKVVCDFTGIRDIFAINFLLEGALLSSGWTVVKFYSPFDADYTIANVAQFMNFHSEWSGAYPPTYTCDQVGGNVRIDSVNGLRTDQKYKLSNNASVDILNASFTDSSNSVSSYFELEDTKCVVRIANSSARFPDEYISNIYYSNCQLANIDANFSGLSFDNTASEEQFRWRGGHLTDTDGCVFGAHTSDLPYPSVDATYRRKLVFPSVQVVNMTVPVNVKAGQIVNVFMRGKLPAFASGLWRFAMQLSGGSNILGYVNGASGEIIDHHIRCVAAVDANALVLYTHPGTTVGLSGAFEAYELIVWVGTSFPQSRSTLFPVNITTYASLAPTVGEWKIADRVFNSAPAVGQPKSWVCTVSGSPGTWVSEGNL